MTTAETLPKVRARIRLRLREIESRASRAPRVDMAARMDAIRLKVAATA